MARPIMEIFNARLAANEAELKQLYMELYHDEGAYNYFLSMLEKMYRDRKPRLRKLDAAREKNPLWYKDQKMLGMQFYTQCFGGNLKGVQSHLDYLQESGINYLHLMPLLESPKEKSDGGYAISDFRNVQPELGTMKDLAELADQCHDRDMVVCIDFVMNHTSDEHEWARRAKAGEEAYQQRYFFYGNWDIPRIYEQTVPQVFPTTAPGNFSWCPQAGKVVMTFFYPYQWDLNYNNPTVMNDMTENMLFLCNQGIDVIRLDAVPYIWKALHTNCRNLPQVHTLVRIMKLASAIVCPGTLLLGEVIMEPDKLAPYFGSVEKPECNMLYNATTMCTTWHTVASQDVRLLKHQMEVVCGLPKEHTFLNYLRCHDDIGWGLDFNFLRKFNVDEVSHKKFLGDYFQGYIFGSASRGELYNDDPTLGDSRVCGTTASLCGMENDPESAITLAQTLHAFLLTQAGLPIIYSGDEIGQTNDYSYHQDSIKFEDSRYVHRGNFNWDAAALRSDETTKEGRLYQMLQKLTKLRATEAPFHADADIWMEETRNNHILSIGRHYNGEKFVGVFNFSRFLQTANIKEPEEYTDMLTGEKLKVNVLTMQPFTFRWLKTKL